MGQYIFSFSFCVFAHFSKFSMYAWGKKGKMLVFTRVYVCVKAKLTLVSFFYFFFMHLPLKETCFFRNPPPPLYFGNISKIFPKMLLTEVTKILANQCHDFCSRTTITIADDDEFQEILDNMMALTR